ncbi:MAG: Stp1/IreP family PP2C-type Ser/Thr phosphatase [Clostridiales bacterium]|nr:Stp1/IreP family PP2C-type Ser/Thr phosphatase [Roseburia sp.]MDD7635676.1 Stp1/IreP family PP2C-type Ser/Thr phosphatase [Clostridiales bacterium]MDY4111230.1 Stp1/IreP family PP2C-type Ser/Thr phosphatase [Roseburia sp.]
MKTFSMTHIGRRRETNQDYMFTSETAVGSLPNLFLVADGMGGHAAGDYASRFTIEKIVEHIKQSEKKEPVTVLKEAVDYANRLLLEEAGADEKKAGMGTTIVAATCQGDKLYTANVGDSRLYVVNEEQIVQITRDHSLVEEMVRLGEMDKEDAKGHPDKNIITRAIGVGSEVTVDFFETRVTEKDTILMCSDGLTNMIDDADIKRIILGQRDIVEKAERLVETANQNGGRDNITVVLIEPFSKEGKE